MLSDKIYNVLKTITQYVLPATASLYFGLSKIWNLPYSEQVVGSILALDVFLGAILGISVSAYNKKMATSNYVQSSMPGLVAPVVGPRTIFTMTSSTYDILYWVAQIVLPALGTLYFAIATIWRLPYGEQVAGTIALVDTFLGVFLGISTNQYNKAKQELPA
jgi:hypothetical protein